MLPIVKENNTWILEWVGRVLRDNKDLQQLADWFLSCPPFPDVECIISISTGVTGDEEANPRIAYAVWLT